MRQKKHPRPGICVRLALGVLAVTAGLALSWALEGIGLLAAVPFGLIFVWLTPELWHSPRGDGF